jgi:hypothetical protein
MRKILLSVAAILGLGRAAAAQVSASPFELRPAKPVVCPARPENMGTHRSAPEAFLHPRARRGSSGPAPITVTYIGFTPEAQQAFQYAIDIWKTQISTSVPIHVEAQWTQLGSGVLGSAGATSVVRNFSGAPQADVWYPVALAEKISGQDLNGAGSAEISASFSSSMDWYYGTDGKTPLDTYDLVSVVLHELCHGLGFVAGTDYDTTTNFGDYGFSAAQGENALPYTFATFIENAAGQRLTNSGLFTNPSAALGTEFTSGGLYFNSPLAAQVNTTPGDKRPRLYAPAKYSGGSSISHLDEKTYPAGSENSLMTYAFGAAEAIHDPGPLVRKMFDEMGWFVTAIRHTPLRDIETSQDFVVRATVESDGTVTPGSVKLNYSINGGAFTAVGMTATGTATQYQAIIPAPALGTTVRYYLSASDNETARTYTAPGQPAPGISPRSTYQFTVGPDVTPPLVAHIPPPYLFATKLPYDLVVQADDNLGISSVVVQYTVNGAARPNLTLAPQPDGITYRGALGTAVAPLVAGDVVVYRVVATDLSARANKTTLGPFTVPIVGLTAPRDFYVNNFNVASSGPADFVGSGFSITKPSGFDDLAIHSSHSYPDQTNLTYQLLVPIIVQTDTAQAKVKFDEIVLAEPGETGSVFGSPDFYDYVVVEGSLDGETWTPLAKGYDSRANSKWLTAYRSKTSGDNSTATGTPALYMPRTISLRDTYKAGTVVQLRFRLFADDAAHGWGWAIDNLNIQNQSKANFLPLGEVNIYPNPTTTGEIRLLAKLTAATANVEVIIRDMLGRPVFRQVLPDTIKIVDMPIYVGTLSAGMYIVSLNAGSRTVTRKVIVQNQ